MYFALLTDIYSALSMSAFEAVSAPQTWSSGLCWSATCGSTKRGQNYHHNHHLIIFLSFSGGDPFALIWGLVLFDEVAVLLCSVNASELASSRTTWTFPQRCESALTDPRCVYSVLIKGWQRETKAKRLAVADGDEWNHGGVGLVNPPIFISSHMTARVHPTT